MAHVLSDTPSQSDVWPGIKICDSPHNFNPCNKQVTLLDMKIMVFVELLFLAQIAVSAQHQSENTIHAGPSIQCGRDPKGLTAMACPEGDGFRPLSNLYPATGVFVRFGRPALLRKLADVILKKKDGTKLNILFDRKEREETLKSLPELFQSPYSEFINFIPLSAPDKWQQDVMTLGVSGKGKPAVVELPRVDAGTSVSELSRICNFEFTPRAYEMNEFRPSDYGGDIVGFPGNIVTVAKDTFSTQIAEQLKTKNKTALLPINMKGFLVGHVDEVIAVIPTNKKAPCDFAIAYSSPRLGLKLARDLVQNGDPKAKLEPTEPFRSHTYSKTGDCLKDLPSGQWGQPLSASEALGCKSFIEYNEKIEDQMVENVAQLKTLIAKRSACPKPETVPLPQLYRYAEEGGRGGAYALNAPPINSLVLGNTMIMPQQSNTAFSSEVNNRLGALGVHPEFVDASDFHFTGGDIHCLTNVMRTCQD